MSQYDWQTYLGKVTQRTSFLIKSGWRSDVEFLVGQPPSQQIVKAHKLILGMSSPVFEAMLLGDMAEQTQPIVIPDVYPDAFNVLLQYVYTDEIRLQSVDRAVDVCYAAKKYMLSTLVRECTQFIWKDMSASNVCKAYEFAKLFDVPYLMDKCLQATASTGEEVLRSESFSDVGQDTLKVILALDEMNVTSELTVYNAAIRWAERECERQDMESTPHNIRKVLGPSVYLIRFLAMTPTEFASGPATSGLFSDDEVLAFLMNLASPGSRPFPTSLDATCLNPSKRKICTKKHHCTLSYPSVMRFSHAPVVTELRLFVDKEILLHGVQFNSQVLPKSSSNTYQESVQVEVCDDDGAVMADTHFSGMVAWDEKVEVSLPAPFRVHQHQRYALRVTFGTPGSYKCYTELLGPVLSEGVHFTCTYLNGILIGIHTITFSCPDTAQATVTPLEPDNNDVSSQ